MITEAITKIDLLIAGKMEKHPCLSGFLFFGLSEAITRRMNDETVFPVVVSADCESNDVFVDDDFPGGIYHRLLSKQYLPAPKNAQYGDDKCQLPVADMILVCWAFRDKINAAADILEMIVYSGFPNHVTAISSNFDRRSVFSGEFSGIPFNLPEDVMLFSMKYRIAFPATDRNCINIDNFCLAFSEA